MTKLSFKNIIIIVIHGIVLWGLCGGTIGIGMSLWSEKTTLIVHAIGAPVFAWLVTMVYYRRFHFTVPSHTALIFVFIIVALDAGLVAPVLEKSYDMFRNALGTWIPFLLILLSTYFTGLVMTKKI